MADLNTPDASSGDETPRSLDISVVFATRDRADQLARTLAAYKDLDLRGLGWELIVIDNNSSDDTSAVIDAAAEHLPLTHLFVAAGGQNRARNVALDQLRGELVIFTDDDVIPDPACLQAYAAAAARWPDDVVFGARIEPRFPENTPEWMRSEHFDFGTTAFARYHPADAEGHVRRHPYGPSFAVRRRALAGRRFPEHLGPQRGAYAMGGEGYFLREFARDGHGYVYVPDARVEHLVREEQIGESWLLKRAHNKGRGQVHLPSDKRPRRLYVGGVPLRLHLATARAWLRYSLARLTQNTERRIKLGIRYQLRLGQIVELRAHRRTPPQSR
ncbi:MAG: glycosyltransferase family 2 protein [Salinisphaera sp.]|uniref:glycosyltransferase family 2 protein n=1 Tax=Salinisphaera sp. TaxID=1914330 RepID=UPI003C7E677B